MGKSEILVPGHSEGNIARTEEHCDNCSEQQQAAILKNGLGCDSRELACDDRLDGSVLRSVNSDWLARVTVQNGAPRWRGPMPRIDTAVFEKL